MFSVVSVSHSVHGWGGGVNATITHDALYLTKQRPSLDMEPQCTLTPPPPWHPQTWDLTVQEPYASDIW